MIAPKDESRDLVMQWLENKGLSENAELSPRSDSVIVKATITQVEKLLNAEYSPFGTNDSAFSFCHRAKHKL
jgi:tripeptidyl-peptidase-1